MANLVINNEVMADARPGQGLLNIARRNQVHIGFVCDGNGLCTTCECRVLSGEEHLSPVNRVERTWLPPRRLDRGYRLACQTRLVDDGPVRILTRAEELRRLWRNIGDPPPGTTGDEQLRRFTRRVIQLNADHLSMFPLNLARTVARIGLFRTILPVQDNSHWLRDIGGVVDARTDGEFNDPSINVPAAPKS